MQKGNGQVCCGGCYLDVYDHLRNLAEELRQARDWEDVDDEWSQAIKAAHPIHTESHETYATAMKMVGHRHSKGQLVALVNWLLIRCSKVK